MKKRIATCLAVIALFSAFPQSVSANDSNALFTYNYAFESGPDTKETFGVSTPYTGAVAIDYEMENVRRNKDVSYYPPSYGIFGGDIPTMQTSLYHAKDQPEYARQTLELGTEANGGGLNGSATASTGQSGSSGSNITVHYTPDNSYLTTNQQYLLTTPTYYTDGSIGSLSIPRLKLNVRVFEGETLDNLQKGVGHFAFTSAWSGNVGIAGHNRGSAGYFEGVKDMRIGDEIVYTTKYGTRTYTVFAKEKISDTNYSKLGWSGENIITLITCVEGVQNQRWVIQGRLVAEK